MSAPRFTPGPWRVVVTDDGGSMVHGESTAIATVWGRDSGPNAHLIAAAPQLYAALAEAMGLLVSFENNDDPSAEAIVDRARAALAKARGDK